MAGLAVSCNLQNKKVDESISKYPIKPTTIIVPLSPGGTADTIARLMQKYIVKYLGQPLLIVNNILDGGGTLGYNALARSHPDGYTIGYASNNAILQPLYGKTRFNYPTALEPIAQITSYPLAIAVLSESPWRTLNDIVEYAKANPGEIKFAHSG
jgi:tripartite-type tricarboxylate transporter receptor subunit TctC